MDYSTQKVEAFGFIIITFDSGRKIEPSPISCETVMCADSILRSLMNARITTKNLQLCHIVHRFAFMGTKCDKSMDI